MTLPNDVRSTSNRMPYLTDKDEITIYSFVSRVPSYKGFIAKKVSLVPHPTSNLNRIRHVLDRLTSRGYLATIYLGDVNSELLPENLRGSVYFSRNDPERFKSVANNEIKRLKSRLKHAKGAVETGRIELFIERLESGIELASGSMT